MPTNETSSVCATRSGSAPAHIAGSANALTRSAIQRCRRLTSPASAPATSAWRHGGTCATVAALSYFPQKIVRLNEERVLLQDAANDDDRMGAERVDDRVTVEPREVVGTDHRIGIARPHLVHARFELEQQVDTCAGLQRPL